MRPNELIAPDAQHTRPNTISYPSISISHVSRVSHGMKWRVLQQSSVSDLTLTFRGCRSCMLRTRHSIFLLPRSFRRPLPRQYADWQHIQLQTASATSSIAMATPVKPESAVKAGKRQEGHWQLPQSSGQQHSLKVWNSLTRSKVSCQAGFRKKRYNHAIKAS